MVTLFGSDGTPATPTPSGAGSAPAPGDIIQDVTAANFEEAVIKASMQMPVIIDFWAPWCGPCKQLTPALESAVLAAKGAVKLAKINTDAEQQLAAMFRIQSIPTVYALFQGQPVDGFQGALPPSELKAFVDKLVEIGGGVPGGIDVDAVLGEAEQALAAGQADQALSLFQEVAAQDEDNPKAIAGTLRCLVALGEVEDAEAALNELPDAMKVRSDFDPVRSAISLARELNVTTPVGELEARLAADENDHQARFDLASARFAAGQREAALETLLDLVRRDRDWNEQAARKQVLKFLDVMGPADPLTAKTRRRLSSLLFS